MRIGPSLSQPPTETLGFLTLMKPLHIPNGGGQSINVLGIPMFVRIHGRDTNRTLSVVESNDAPGGGPPPHIHHREDETFQILEGEYEFMVDGKTILAKQGATVFAPRGIPHTYRNAGPGEGRMVVTLTPSGFEDFFLQIGAMTPEEQQNIPRVIEIAKTFGLEFLPPPAA